MDPANSPAKFEVRIALPVPEIIAVKVLGELGTPILGGRGWYHSKER